MNRQVGSEKRDSRIDLRDKVVANTNSPRYRDSRAIVLYCFHYTRSKPPFLEDICKKEKSDRHVTDTFYSGIFHRLGSPRLLEAVT